MLKLTQTYSDISDLQEIEEEDVIEEYLDEYLDEIRNENSVYALNTDHQYTNIIVEEKIQDEEVNEDLNTFEEEPLEPDVKTSKKQYHKFHQLTGLFVVQLQTHTYIIYILFLI
jgi:hypothetical protein